MRCYVVHTIFGLEGKKSICASAENFDISISAAPLNSTDINGNSAIQCNAHQRGHSRDCHFHLCLTERDDIVTVVNASKSYWIILRKVMRRIKNETSGATGLAPVKRFGSTRLNCGTAIGRLMPASRSSPRPRDAQFLPACQVFLLLLELDSSGFLVFLLPTSATSLRQKHGQRNQKSCKGNTHNRV